jgi:tetratricopeptide (TPR) repeat protein
LGARFDVFLSYNHKDGPVAERIVAALRAAGLTVFFDRDEVEDFQSITAHLRDGLAHSSALLALYSATYPSRRACQFELTSALIAGQRLGGPHGRVLVVNPEPEVEHIQPVQLRDALFRRCPEIDDDAAFVELAAAVARHVSALEQPLGEAAPLTPRWLGMRPSAATRFVGRRTAMWEIHSALHAGEFQPITGIVGQGVAQIRGLGGIGKTLLAQEYALRFGAAFPGGIFWLRAGGDPLVGAPAGIEGLEAARAGQLRALADACEIALPETSTLAQVEGALARMFTGRDLPFLWVVDDVPGDLDADALSAWFAPHPLGRTLLTTRSGRYGALAVSVEPSVLAADDATELLAAHRAPADRHEEQEAARLAHELGFHALALDVAGAAIAGLPSTTPFATFRAELCDGEDDALEFAAQLADVLPTGHSPSIAATLLASIRGLGSEGLDLLRIAATLSPAPVPADFVADVLQRADDASEGDAQRRVGIARTEVWHASLVERAENGVADVVHALVSRTILFHAEPESSGRIERLRTAAVSVIKDRLSVDWADGGERATVEALIPHARHVAGAVADEPLGIEMLAALAYYDGAVGSYGSARELQEQVLTAQLHRYGAQHPETLNAMISLGETLRVQGALAEARALEERAVEALQRVRGANHPRTLDAMNNLAATLLDLGDLAGACRLQELVLEGRVRQGDNLLTLKAMGNLSETLRAQGDLAGARRLQELVVEGNRRLLGASHPDLLISMSAVAMTMWELREFDRAREIEERVLEVSTRELGRDHPTTIISMINLGETLAAQGDHTRARELREQALESALHVLGPDHPTTWMAMSNLGLALAQQGELERGLAIQEQAFEARLRWLGEEHPDTLVSMSNLGSTRAAQRDLHGALELAQRTLEIRRRTLGETHPSTVNSARIEAEIRKLLE